MEIARPGTMRRRYDQNAQRTIWVPSRPNKRSREEVAEIDGEITQCTNRLGGRWLPTNPSNGGQTEPNSTGCAIPGRTIDPESEGENQIIRGDNLPYVDLKNYNTEGKESHYVQ